MRNLRNVSAWRLAALSTLTPLVFLFAACEKPDGGGGGAGTPFALPEVDVRGLSEGLQGRLVELRERVRESPQDADQVGALGAIYYVHGFPDAAAACFTRAKELTPQTMHWWYYAGLAYERAGQPEKANEAFRRGLELDAEYGPLYVALAGLLVDSDRERAARLCQRALELNPRDSTAIFTLGLCDEAAGDQDAALRRFGEALQLVPSYKGAHEAAARLLSAAGRTEEAERHSAAALSGITPRVDDRLVEALLRRGLHLETLLVDAVTFAERGLFEEVEVPLSRARLVDDAGVATHRATGIVRALEGRLEEAAAEFRAVLEARPDSLEARSRLGDVLARLQEFPEAEAEFRTVLEKDPNSAFALERLSRLLAMLKRAEEAEELLRDAADRQPEAPWIRLQLGGLLYDANKNDQAREQLNKCLELSPEDVRARFILGLLARREGDLAEAVKYWQQAVELAPNFLDAHVVLAETAIQERDFTAAERYLREALKQAPDFAGLANGLAWILATSPTDSQRNGEEALRLAEKACRLTQNQQHGYVDTLAAAYAELGRFDEAIKTQQDAIKLAQQAEQQAEQQENLAAYEERLKLYEQKQPFRDIE